MQKRSLIFSLLILIPLISAYNSYGFSMGSFDIQSIFLGGIFIGVFALIIYPLGKVFRDSKWTSAVVSGVIAMFVTYGAYSSGWSLDGIFSDIGIDFEYLPMILGIILLALMIWAIIKIGFGIFIALIGLAGIVAPFIFDYIVNKTAMIIIGAILFLIGLSIWGKFKKKASQEIIKEEENKEGKLRQILNFLREAQSRGDRKRSKKLEREVRKLQQEIMNLRGKAVQRRKEEAQEKQKSIYKAMMRRGGEKDTRGRFVSKKAVDRYARRFGEEAARKRFES